MCRTILDRDDIELIKVLYKHGLTQKKLAKMYRVGIKTIRKVLRNKYKVPNIYKEQLCGWESK